MDCLWKTVVISSSQAILTRSTDSSCPLLCKSQTEGRLTDYQWDRIDEAITLEARFTHFLSFAQFGIVISQQFPAASAQQRFEAVWSQCDSNGEWEQHSKDLFDPSCHCSSLLVNLDPRFTSCHDALWLISSVCLCCNGPSATKCTHFSPPVSFCLRTRAPSYIIVYVQ